MRGALVCAAADVLQGRIIPADAGSTPSPWPGPAPPPDHPRGCGEHCYSPANGLKPPGSSPRMRGAQSPQWEPPDRRGIIPADAGSTRLACAGSRSSRDHPRGCGEHRLSDLMTVREGGSSPRMRGALPVDVKPHDHAGIIPADAGSTGLWVPWSGTARDHPRGCGEHKRQGNRSGMRGGSSPRMRGALDLLVDLGPRTGIIPADAGSTHFHACACSGQADHPRGCGEHRIVC